MSTDNVNSVFDAFVQAKEALMRVPELEKRNERLSSILLDTNDTLEHLKAELDAKMSRIIELDSQLRDREAALAQATFREEALRGKLEAVVSVLKDTMTEAKAVVELIEPEPNDISNSSTGEPHTETSPKPYVSYAEWIEGYWDGKDYVEGHFDYKEKPDDKGYWNENPGQSAQNPTTSKTSPSAPLPDAQSPPAPSAGSTDVTLSTDVSSLKAEDRDSANPTSATAASASLTAELSQPVESPTTQSPVSPSTDASSAKPYEGQNWYLKPESLSWPVWITLGGEDAPPHYTKSHEQSL